MADNNNFTGSINDYKEQAPLQQELTLKDETLVKEKVSNAFTADIYMQRKQEQYYEFNGDLGLEKSEVSFQKTMLSYYVSQRGMEKLEAKADLMGNLGLEENQELNQRAVKHSNRKANTRKGKAKEAQKRFKAAASMLRKSNENRQDNFVFPHKTILSDLEALDEVRMAMRYSAEAKGFSESDEKRRKINAEIKMRGAQLAKLEELKAEKSCYDAAKANNEDLKEYGDFAKIYNKAMAKEKNIKKAYEENKAAFVNNEYIKQVRNEKVAENNVFNRLGIFSREEIAQQVRDVKTEIMADTGYISDKCTEKMAEIMIKNGLIARETYNVKGKIYDAHHIGSTIGYSTAGGGDRAVLLYYKQDKFGEPLNEEEAEKKILTEELHEATTQEAREEAIQKMYDIIMKIQFPTPEQLKNDFAGWVGNNFYEYQNWSHAALVVDNYAPVTKPVMEREPAFKQMLDLGQQMLTMYQAYTQSSGMELDRHQEEGKPQKLVKNSYCDADSYKDCMDDFDTALEGYADGYSDFINTRNEYLSKRA